MKAALRQQTDFTAANTVRVRKLLAERASDTAMVATRERVASARRRRHRISSTKRT